mgnify:CR=1 FL=1
MSENVNKNVVVFSDATGRVLIGESVQFSEKTSKIKNPMIIQAQDRGNGQMAIGCIPYTYLELFDVDSEGVWTFPTETIVWCDDAPSKETVDLYFAVVTKYNETRLNMSQSKQEQQESEGSGIVGANGDVVDFTS